MTRLAVLVLTVAVPSWPGNWQAVEVRSGKDRIDILVGGRPFTSYYFGSAAAKPYLFPLRSAQGTVITRGFPMEHIPGEDHDEPHQRAMYFAHGDINGYDFWGEAEFARWSRHSKSMFGRTVFRELAGMRDGNDSGTLQAEFDLVTTGGQVIATETQA
jgi:Methane oxygenase PmoA